MRKENGITLIALVITIIVLLILAGVSIALLTSEGNIPEKANQAVALNELSTAKEAVMLKATDAIAAYYDAKYNGGSTTATSVADAVKAATYTSPSAKVQLTHEANSATISLVVTGTGYSSSGLIGANGGITWTDTTPTPASNS